MTTRYNTNSNIKTSYNGKQFFGTRTYPIINPDDSDIIYITKDNDYLDALAFKFYKDQSMWWIIAQANNLGMGRLSIQGGLQLRIPTRLSSILINYNNSNNI